MRLIHRLIATGCYVGYAPIAPGTFGSLLGLFLYWAIPKTETWYLSIVIFALFFLGVWSATEVEKESGKDAQIIVIDEIVGMLITVFLTGKSLLFLGMGFVLFRLFDIVKLYPARLSEKLPGGWGVMMDDVIAGTYGLIALRLVSLFVK